MGRVYMSHDVAFHENVFPYNALFGKRNVTTSSSDDFSTNRLIDTPKYTAPLVLSTMVGSDYPGPIVNHAQSPRSTVVARPPWQRNHDA